MHPIDVSVFDEQEIFRRGVVACLGADSLLHVVADAPSASPVAADVAVVSVAIASSTRLGCALVVSAVGMPSTRRSYRRTRCSPSPPATA